MNSSSDDLASLRDKLYLKHNNESKATDIMSELVEQIVVSAQNKDYNSIKSLFSEYAQNNNTDIEDEIIKFCDCCSFDTNNMDQRTVCNVSLENGKDKKIIKYYGGRKFVDGLGVKYIIHIGWVANDTTDMTRIGIQFIDIIKEEESSQEKLKYFDDKPGIYVLD